MSIPRRARAAGAAGCLVALTAVLGGCVVTSFLGGAAQNFEYQKKIEVLPRYDGLEGRSVAVIVEANYEIAFDYPNLVRDVTGGLSVRIAKNVPDVTVLAPDLVLRWQWSTPQWNALSFGQMAEALSVDRVVYVEIYEYRLHPPGNRYLWEGVAAGTFGVIERDGFDPDAYADSFEVNGEFPKITVPLESASTDQIQTGVLAEFIKRGAWLFYRHEEPKYPDKYRPELDR